MIPGILNTLVGLVLVYMSVLHLEVIEGRVWHLLVAGIVIIVLALWSRRADAMRWFSSTTIVLGVLLLLFGLLQWMTEIAHLFVFWFVFFDGIMVAVVSLWGALFRPRPQVAMTRR
ncbi:MAG: hypothetical protein R3F24_11340 [Gammaproteobacteria bacterium]